MKGLGEAPTLPVPPHVEGLPDTLSDGRGVSLGTQEALGGLVVEALVDASTDREGDKLALPDRVG